MEISLLLDQLTALLAELVGPIVATIVSTIMGTELFKRLFPNMSSRVVTWIVYGLLILVATFVLDILPIWFILLIAFASSGVYSQVFKALLDWGKEKLGLRRRVDPPVGGGGSGPIA